MIKPYTKLAELYDSQEWGKFSLSYISILDDLKKRYNFDPRSIIDISCGTGQLINELGKKYEVVGSDISAEMIEIARKKYPNITFYISDMADLRLKEKYDIVLSPFDSINYLIEKDHLVKAFKNIYDLLRETGHFFFDFNTDKLYEDKHKGIIERKAEGVNFKQICEYDKNRRIAKTVFDFGDGLNEIHIQKPYTYNEINDLLINIGFKTMFSIDMFNNKEISNDSYKILIFAKKNGGSGI